jgi:hypothetical protein
MKQLIRQRIAPLALLLIACTFFSGCGISHVINSATQLDRADAKEFTVDKTEVASITEIEIHTRIADVEFLQSDSFAVEINYLYWDREPEYEMKDGKLYFDDSDSFPISYSSISTRIHHLKFIAKGQRMKYVSIEDASGDVDITGFCRRGTGCEGILWQPDMQEASASAAEASLIFRKEQNIRFSCGDDGFYQFLWQCKFTNINSGDFILPKGAVSKECNISMSSGNVDIDGMYSPYIDIQNSYGDVPVIKLGRIRRVH